MAKIFLAVYRHTLIPSIFSLVFLSSTVTLRYMYPDSKFLPLALNTLLAILLFSFVSLLLYKEKTSSLSSLRLQRYTYGILIAFLFNLNFVVIGPAIIDRSLTVFILSSLDNQSRSMTSNELQQTAQEGWWDAGRQIEYRLKEELLLGNIEQTFPDQFCVTNSGRKYLGIARFISMIFTLDSSITKNTPKLGIPYKCRN